MKAVFFAQGDGHPRDEEDALWWFDSPDITLATAFEGEEQRAVCDTIRLTFDYCPNPEADHFDTSALKDEVEGVGVRELFRQDLARFVSMVEACRDGFYPGEETVFYLLYEVEMDEFRDEDGGLDQIVVMPRLVGNLDLEALARLLDHE